MAHCSHSVRAGCFKAELKAARKVTPLKLLVYAWLTADALAGLPAAAGVVEGFAGRFQMDRHGGPHGTITIQPCQVTTPPSLYNP